MFHFSAERRKERVRTSQVWTNGSCRSRAGQINLNGNNENESQLANGCITNRAGYSLKRGTSTNCQYHVTSFDSEQPLTFEQ
ncbi:hypothetical protein GCK32_022231, partial [Trichostrongylus colubriformis]